MTRIGERIETRTTSDLSNQGLGATTAVRLREWIAPMIERVLDDAGGGRRTMLYGAGCHTLRLLADFPALAEPPIIAVLDDGSTHLRLGSIPMLTPDEAAARDEEPEVILLSSDAWGEAMAECCRRVFSAHVRLVDLYDGLPHGGYRVEAAPSSPGLYGGTEITDTLLERALVRALPRLVRLTDRRASLRGPIDAALFAACFLRENGFEITARGRAIDIETSDAPITRPPRDDDDADVPIALFRRPHVDADPARPALPRTRAMRQRLVIRHDNHLGDVVLSQGVLPQRLKTEVDPDAHVTFVTMTSHPNRARSASTGWCLDLLRHNPWIDEIAWLPQAQPRSPSDRSSLEVTPEDPTTAAAWEAFVAEADGSFHISSNGLLYDNVFHAHAYAAELPPGRTDARVYCDDADRELARDVLGPRRRTRVAVNMSLAAERFRGWGAVKTHELCERLEDELDVELVWIGSTDFGPHRRLRHGGRALTVREQAAVLAECDLHIAGQGAGANLSAAVGTQTLSLSGCHPPYREGVAYFNNPYIEDASRRHVEMYVYRGELRVLNYATNRDVEWSLYDDETEADVRRYVDDLWYGEATPAALGERAEDEPYTRVRRVSVDDVMDVAAAMLEALRTGSPAPGV